MSEVMLKITNPVTSAEGFLDLSENENIAMNFRYSDISELDVRGSFSRQFRIPATENNNSLLGAIFDVNYSGGFSFHTKAPAEITVDTLPINNGRGHIQVRKVFLQKGEFAEYELAFFSETPDLTRALGTKKLSDLDFTALAHDISFADVTTGGTDWKYALTDRGQKWTQADGTGLRTVLSTDVPVMPNEMTLIVRWLWLFNKIMSEAGFTYSGSTLQTRLNLIWMPFVKALVNLTGIPDQTYFFNVGLSSDQPGFTGGQITSIAEIFDNNNDFSADQWTAPYTGYFTFKGWVTFDPFSFPSSQTAKFQIKRTDTLQILKSKSIIVSSSEERNMQVVTDPVFLSAGDTVGIFLELSTQLSSLTVTLKSNVNNDPATGTGLSMIAAQTPVAGVPISIAANCPDYLQIDFVKDVAKMLNLVIIPDNVEPSKLKMIPASEYLSAGVVKDWTGKVDLSKDIVIEPTPQKKKLSFTYKQGSDALSKLYEKLGRVYGNYIIDGYTPNDFADGELKIELSIASTPCTYINNSNIIIPKFVNESGEYQEPGPRALFITGQTDIAIYNESTPGGEFAAINLINHYSAVDPTVTDLDLNFAPETPLHEITANPYNNLFNQYYRAYLNELYSPDARIYTGHFKFDETDMFTFQFNDKLWIKDAMWRVIDVIDYGVGLQESTQVKLVKIIGTIADCAVFPVSVGRNGIIIFEDQNSDPASATEQCCLRYGYQWNDDDNTCRSLSGNGADTPGASGINTGRLPNTNENLERIGVSVAEDSEQRSLITGVGINVGTGNANSLIVADTVDVEDNIGGVIVTGTNVVARFPGVHRGGGFPVGTRSEATGSAQAGNVILYGNGNYMTTGSAINIDAAGAHINIPDNSTVALEVRVSAHRYSTSSGLIIGNHYVTFVALINKTGGIAYVKKQDTIFQDGNFGTLALVFDTATNTAQHRMSIESSGRTYPIDTVRITADVAYSQVVTLGAIDFYQFRSLIKFTTVMDIFIPASPAWEKLSDVDVMNSPTRVSYTNVGITTGFADAVIDAQSAMATANATGSPDYNYVIISAFFDDHVSAWTFIMENQQ